MKVKQTRARITPEVFENVKLLQKTGGLSAYKTAKIIGISSATVYRIFTCENWANYKQKITEHNAGQRARKVEQKYSTPVADHNVNDVRTILTNIYDRLEQIEGKQDSILGKVKWIEDNVEVKTKRKFF